MIQRNAIGSWIQLKGRIEIILFGSEAGTEEFCQKNALRHAPWVETNEFGTPLISSLWEEAERLASTPYLAYVNADIILMDDFVEAVERVRTWSKGKPFILAGKRTCLDMGGELDFSQANWREDLLMQCKQRGVAQPHGGIDYLVCPKGFMGPVLPFAIGRGWWDQWLVWEAHRLGGRIVDATACLLAIHQNHDYEHSGRGADWIWHGPEIQRNRKLAGEHLWHTAHANFELCPSGVRRLWTRRALRVLLDRTRSFRRKVGLTHRGIGRLSALLRGGRPM